MYGNQADNTDYVDLLQVNVQKRRVHLRPHYKDGTGHWCAIPAYLGNCRVFCHSAEQLQAMGHV